MNVQLPISDDKSFNTDMSYEDATKVFNFYMNNKSRLQGDLLVSRCVDGHPWFVFRPSSLDTWSWRRLFDNEIVFDIDLKGLIGKEEYKKNLEGLPLDVWFSGCYIGEKLTRLLSRDKIPHWFTYSGGNGVHIHIFYDKTGLPDRPAHVLRSALARGIAHITFAEIDPFIINNIIDWHVIDSKTHLIREFGSGKKKGYRKTILDQCPAKFEQLENVFKLPEKVSLWKPTFDIEMLLTIPFSQTIEKKEHKPKKSRFAQDLKNVQVYNRIDFVKADLPPCLLSMYQKFEDCKREQTKFTLPHFARFAFTIFLFRMGWNLNEIATIFECMEDYSETYTKYQIIHIMCNDYKMPSCPKMQMFNLCPKGIQGYCLLTDHTFAKSPIQVVLDNVNTRTPVKLTKN